MKKAKLIILILGFVLLATARLFEHQTYFRGVMYGGAGAMFIAQLVVSFFENKK